MSTKPKRHSPYYTRPLVFAQRPCSCGFTMIELVITVLILGIVAAVGAPRFAAALDHARVRAAALRVESDLKYARQLAKQTSQSQRVTFDAAANQYTLQTMTDVATNTLVNVPDRDHPGKDYTVTLSSKEFNTEITSADFGGSTSVTFDIYGHADSAGTVVVQSGDRTEAIVVDAYGHVSNPEPE